MLKKVKQEKLKEVESKYILLNNNNNYYYFCKIFFIFYLYKCVYLKKKLFHMNL
jgi:hypothetical protein